ncbi:bifunctional precorrin-2 dehydrogenase/sirohydrochlorin ferrochelatase [Myxococcus sp. K15C18031901]|uniref:precorrin-2 dehydrogenase/sirohydrochlorin ferrochelatase family protein n=1 Tax=Myxococcus dinghuensis TaxID=2906761 RepID=UPI0020A81C3A|nr:bifunctional precorrin-2 dehydrogenase/sirohydrochlorin ferrochelatase [Myxococcus dinghuensis]MCP3097502.1 bifunctional precorrin-2 dehydrogenase/sirohydrochlorin ferrochelatase [Myxococcus dinghuensis]
MGSHVPDYPVCLRLAGRRVLLVGGGNVAEGRALALVDAGARVHLIAPEVTAALRALAATGRLEWEPRVYAPGDARGHALVLVATDEPRVGLEVADEARALGLWVNVADEPALCDFTLPSVERRGPITVAVSTAGLAPALARHLRRELARHVEPHHVWLARLSGWLRRHLPRGAERQRLLKRLVDGDIGALLARGERAAATARLRTELKHWKSSGEPT